MKLYIGFSVSVVYLLKEKSFLNLEKKSFINACSQRKICKEMWKRHLWIRIVHVGSFILHNIFSNIITR